MSCGVGDRCSSDPTLLWRWCRLEATVPTGPLAWEPPYATGTALKDKKYPPLLGKKQQQQQQQTVVQY